MLLKVLEFNNDLRVLIRSYVSFGVDRSNNSISKGAIINNNGVSKNFTNSITISKKSKKYLLIRTLCVSFGVDGFNNAISKGVFINDNGVDNNVIKSIIFNKKSKKYLFRNQKIPGEKKGFLLKIFEFNNKLGVLIKVV